VKNTIKLVLLTVLLTAGSLFAQGQKTGYVDSEVILKQFSEAIKAQGQLDALIEQWNAQIDSMTYNLQQAYQNYQKQSGNMKEDKKLEEQQKLVQQQQVIEEYKRTKFGQGTGEIYKKQDELLKPVKEKIFKAIESVAKDEGMHFVFDKTGEILLLYADQQFDITYKVLDRLKRGK